MTSQEKQLLERFLADMVAARAGAKDPEAEALIRESVSRQPDAAYLLVQRALQLDQALQIREAELRRLESALAQAKADAGGSGGRFLGNDPYAWGRGAAPGDAAPSGAQSPGAMPIPGVQPQAALPPQQQPAPAAPRASPWGGSSMLGTVASTAAGVVAGSFLYQGIQNLLHRNDPQWDAPGHAQSGEHHAQSLLGDSSGFDNLVPDDGELQDDMLAGGDDDTDYT